jgi:quercetin dioxygenase-like cupin family protein
VNRRTVVIALALTTVVACGDLPQPSPDAQVSKEVLIDKARSTTLDQDLQYPTDSHAEVSSAIVTIPPGAETGWHRHDTPLVVDVIEGVVTVEYDGGIVKEYGPGDTFVEAIGTRHNGRNLGDVDVVIYTVSIGAEGLQNTVSL